MSDHKRNVTTPHFSDGEITRLAIELQDSLRFHDPRVVKKAAEAIRTQASSFQDVTYDIDIRNLLVALARELRREGAEAPGIVADALLNGTTNELWKTFGALA